MNFDLNSDRFKNLVKYFKKQKCGEKILQYDVAPINFKCLDLYSSPNVTSVPMHISRKLSNPFLKDTQEWRLYKIIGALPGLFLVPNIFTISGSRHIFDLFLRDIPFRYSSYLRSNLNTDLNQANRNFENLRWLTFGYHHNWNDKVYRDDDRDPIPSEIINLLTHIIDALDLKFKIEAGIINYYTCKSTLNPHVDLSEINQSVPLLSLSLGCSCIFLIGGEKRTDENILPIVLNDGDLLIMSSKSRLSYHAVASVFCDDKTCNRKQIKRININARQVY